MIEDECAGDGIPLPNVDSPILADGGNDFFGSAENVELKNWDADFVKVDQPTLFGLILAAKYLNISGLLDLTCNVVADMMKGKTPEQMSEIFHIKNDYTPQEEAGVRRENQWAFE